MTETHRPAFGGLREDAEPDDAVSVATREDLALLGRLRAGDDAAFGELFSRHCDAVRRLALGLVNDRAEAEDLTAEAFFRVLQAIRRGSGPVDNVRGYLLIVARRVAWEWNGRKRDVPVSDEELNHRVGADPDNTGQSTERTLITRAFTSLPERWRTVLWKVEVEGERPAVVAVNFGLSPNATAALARRARQGLRAAYLQAHLTVERGSTGCRSALEKLGAYTAGSIKGAERRKVRAHLATCASCTAMQAELQDVCSGLRAHAAFLAVPVAGLAMWQQAATAGVPAVVGGAGFGTALKGFLTSAKVQISLAATSAAAVGAFGLALVPWGESGEPTAFDDFDGAGPTELVVTGTTSSGTEVPRLTDHPAPKTATSEHQAKPAAVAPERRTPVGAARPRGARPGTSTAEPGPSARSGLDLAGQPENAYDDSLPVVYSQSYYERKYSIYDRYDVVTESTTVTRVNSANQTTVATQTTSYTRHHTPQADPDEDYAQILLSPTGGPGPGTTDPQPTGVEPTNAAPAKPAEPEPAKEGPAGAEPVGTESAPLKGGQASTTKTLATPVAS